MYHKPEILKLLILAVLVSFAAGMILQDKLFVAEDSYQCREVCIGHSIKRFDSCYCMAEVE